MERDDWKDEAPKDWFRLAPGKEVRLRYACLVTCTDVVRDAAGEPVEIKCRWDEQSWGGTSPDGRVVKGTLHWVSEAHAVKAEVRLYDRLFSTETPGADEGKDWLTEINPDSLVVAQARVEPHLAAAAEPGSRWQFERLAYFCADKDSRIEHLIFNRTVTLKDTWAKIEKKQAAPAAAPAKKKDAGGGGIAIDDVKKVDLRVGLVKTADLVDGADKLLKLQVDIGEEKPRQIFAGIRRDYPDPSVLVGKSVIVVANLKPRQMKFGLSEGMLLAAGSGVATVNGEARPGDKVS
jgi:methionine--tRNA ligase beta chain